jgi:hypothetical protein
MKLVKDRTKKTAEKPVVLVRNNVNTYAEKFDGKSLVDIIEEEGDDLINIMTGISSAGYPALLLEYKDKILSFPFSNSIDETFMDSEDGLDGTFRKNRTQARDKAGNILPGETPENGTGPMIISYGKTGTITYSDVKTVAGVVVPA